ncbi:hypothetical protein D3C81_804340 [compost metagenome]
MKNILSFKEGTPILGKEVKEWILFNTNNKTSHSKVARGFLKYLNISDSKFYKVNLHPSGTGCGEIGSPTIELLEK